MRCNAYWSAPGGRYAAAIVRIAIATSVLWSLWRLARPATTGDVALYRPVGIWMAWGGTPPPSGLVDALWVVAWVATGLMFAGLYTRTSTIASFFASVAIAALSYSSSRTWSHPYNVVFLAQLAFLGSRSGDVWSIDAAVRRLRGRPPLDLARRYQWSLRLVQLAVALMFAGAAFFKLWESDMTLRWALSDNLRNQLLVKYDLAGLERPRLVDWLIDDPWRFRTAALLNLVSQSAPLAACFLVRRPVWRAVAGAFFAIETIALGLVVDLWNLHWLPLVAVFVDWDWLLRRPVPDQVASDDSGPGRIARSYIVAFLAYDALTAFIPSLDQRLNTYPFSGFPMFAKLRVRAPYDKHLPFSVPGDQFELFADREVPPYVQRWFDHINRGAIRARNAAELHARLASIFGHARKLFPNLGLRGFRLHVAIFESPAVPAPARLHPKRIAIVGEYRDDGTFRTELGAPPNGELIYYKNDLPEPIPYAGKLEGDSAFLVRIDRDGSRWLLRRAP